MQNPATPPRRRSHALLSRVDPLLRHAHGYLLAGPDRSGFLDPGDEAAKPLGGLREQQRAGFNVDMQVMDWATLLQHRSARTGWNIYGVHALGLDLQSPLTSSVINFNCKDSPGAGFMCEQRLVPLFDAFAKAPTRDAQRAIAGQIQAIVTEQALAVPFGQFAQPAAYRVGLTGVIPSAIPLFWNVEKK